MYLLRKEKMKIKHCHLFIKEVSTIENQIKRNEVRNEGTPPNFEVLKKKSKAMCAR